ncbi:uncharacterized protein BJ212DRAFT_1364045 [Suillus subaureus]|uniref:Sacsin/Nov domain-containing protein n=1 Tax=Suillus subaureus TaxID=48587 RepID=A0A9P7E867_9AGAM|nr:uncharacterized protein BJ212DRAFT_1364045 [Suillus subaureus]KAG1813853.1 hypothetical protein BJ212DRAFT_1364045 [Suillus subaureus]
MCEPEAVEVNQRNLVDKVLARYPEEFTVFRELLQNADDAGAENFDIVFESLHRCASNGTTQGLNSAKVFKWLVKNDGAQFQPDDWKRLTKIAEGNPDERKIGAFGVGFFSVFSVTDKPIVKSNGKMVSIYYGARDQLFVKKEQLNCDCDGWTVIEMELKQESTTPRVFELARFLVTSVTFLAHIQRVRIFLDNTELSCLTKTRNKASQSIPILEHMNRKSRDGTMIIDSVELITQEVNVTFFDDALVGGPKMLVARAEPEEGGNPTKSKSFFSTEKMSKLNGRMAAPKLAAVASEALSLKSGTQFSAKCSIYSAKVTVSPKSSLEKGLESAMKKKLPKDFLFEMVFFSKDEHDKQSQGEVGNASVFRGPQGLCPRLEAEHPARIFIGQSTAQTTGMACHMSGRFIPTVERGSIDLANGHVLKWNEELLYVGGFLARVAYESEMNKVKDLWPTLQKQDAEQLASCTQLALYTMKSFVFHPSTPDPKVSQIIKDAFYACSTTDKFPFISDQGIRYTKDIRLYHHHFAQFMRTPVFPVELRPISTSMALPEHLRIGPYTFKDVVKELDSRWLSESEMAACLRWWGTSFGSQGPLDEQHRKWRNELLKAGRTHSGGKEVRLSSISKFIDGRMLSVRRSDDPLPDDTIPPVLIQSLTSCIPEAFGWQEMSIIHWLRHLSNSPPDAAHDITRTHSFATHVLNVLSTIWTSLDDNSRFEVREILEVMTCIPTTTAPYMMRPQEAYFPEADVFRDLPVVRQDLLFDFRTEQVLQYLGVQKQCDIDTFIVKAMSGDRWNAVDLARYLITSAPSQEHVTRVMEMKIFPCDGERRHISELFASTEINRALKLPVINCEYWDSNTQEGLFLIRKGLHEYPTIEQLIPIASSKDDHAARRAAFAFLCGPFYETFLEKQFDPSKFSTYPFIPGVRDGRACQIPHGEVFSDPNWKVFGFGHLTDQFNKKNITKLKIRDRPTAEKLFQVLESTPPKDPETAERWFRFLAEKGVFSAGEFERIADLKIVPVEVSSDQPRRSKISYEAVSPRECFLKSESYPEDHFYQQLFKFVDFGRSANAFLKACGVKERPECIDVLKVLLRCPKTFLKLAGDDHERYLTELRLIAVGHKSLPRRIHEEMRTASIFLGYRRGKSRDGFSHEADVFELCKADEVLVADDMESRRTFGDCIFIAPQEELLEKFYSEMKVKSLSSCIKYTVEPDRELLSAQSARDLRKSIIDKIPIFLHEFDEPRFRERMRLLRWHDENQFFVRACRRLDVTKRLDFPNATIGPQGQKAHPTELSAETQIKDGVNVLWIKEPKADSYDIAAALCRLLFSTYKKNDVLSLMTILDTDINVLKRRGYDVDRILSEYRENLEKAEHGENPSNGVPPGPVQAPSQDAPPGDEPTCDKPEPVVSKFTKFLHRLRKDPKLGEIKLSEIENSIEKVKNIMKEEGGNNDLHISNREQVGGGKKQKNVAYCDEKKVAKTDLEECEDQHVGQVKVWKRKGTILGVPPKEREAFGNIISDLAKVFSINQTRCHVFFHGEDSNLMGFNRNDQIFFGLEHYMQNHKDAPAGKAYVDWYYIMAHEMAHVHTPYHDEHHELLFQALATRYLTELHNLPAVRELFKCTSY